MFARKTVVSGYIRLALLKSTGRKCTIGPVSAKKCFLIQIGEAFLFEDVTRTFELTGLTHEGWGDSDVLEPQLCLGTK